MGFRTVLMLQGFYFSLTGIWPIAHIDSFMLVTGPKTDIWLVRTVGALITVIGISFLLESRKAQLSDSILFLALFSSFSLMLVDVIYSLNDTISDIYLADALPELFFTGYWIIYFLRRKRGRNGRAAA
jgi:hypothetical protein